MHTLLFLVAFALYSGLVQALHSERHHALHGRATSLDNICGPKNGFTCDPDSLNGGPCCSASGYCGSSSAYCETGCQDGYGTCTGSGSGSDPGSNYSSSPSGASLTSRPGNGEPGSGSGSCSVVDGVGSFARHVTYDFSAANSIPSGLHAVANAVNTDPEAPYSMDSQTSLVIVGQGYMQLKVPGGQRTSPIHTAQVQTLESEIKYGSVRTTAILSSVKGVCHGMFFYKNDSQEIDIEFLSDSSSTSNPGDGSTPLHFTNQAIDNNPADKTLSTYPMPSDAFTKEHEYRIDWLPGYTAFFVDGKQVRRFTKNIPTVPGYWIWNNWSNGGRGWTVGPPSSDNVFKISKIEMYYNTTTSSC